MYEVFRVALSHSRTEYFVYYTDVGGEEGLDHIIPVDEPDRLKRVLAELADEHQIALENY
jgi:hypothetical protein